MLLSKVKDVVRSPYYRFRSRGDPSSLGRDSTPFTVRTKIEFLLLVTDLDCSTPSDESSVGAVCETRLGRKNRVN